VTVNIGFSTNITEQESSEDIYRESSLNLLREQQEKIIKSQVEDIITFAQENNVDIFGIADAVRLKYPVKWEKIKDRWDEIFPSIEIKPEVKSKINMPYAIEQPVKGR
jgi:spore germination protein KC